MFLSLVLKTLYLWKNFHTLKAKRVDFENVRLGPKNDVLTMSMESVRAGNDI